MGVDGGLGCNGGSLTGGELGDGEKLAIHNTPIKTTNNWYVATPEANNNR